MADENTLDRCTHWNTPINVSRALRCGPYTSESFPISQAAGQNDSGARNSSDFSLYKFERDHRAIKPNAGCCANSKNSAAPSAGLNSRTWLACRAPQDTLRFEERIARIEVPVRDQSYVTRASRNSTLLQPFTHFLKRHRHSWKL